MIIGVTGLIGSGKSEVSSVFKSLGAEVVNADELGREVVESDHAILYKLVLEFGESILTPHKTPDRQQLGRLAFASKSATGRLNDIVHPPLLKKLDDIIAQARQRDVNLVIDAALLIYWGYHKKIDATVLVSATPGLRRNRIMARGLTRQEFDRRTASQLSEKALRRSSDHILPNNGTLKNLQKRAEKLYQHLIELG